MASGKGYLTFLLEGLGEEVSWRPMMGEFILYFRGKVVGGVYDDRLLVKPTRSARALLPDAPRELPYPGGQGDAAGGGCGQQRLPAGAAGSRVKRGISLRQLFLIKVFLQRGQVMRILPLPRGTRTVARHWGQRKYLCSFRSAHRALSRRNQPAARFLYTKYL